MAVTEIMYPDSFYPTFLTSTIHLVGKIIFRDRENSVIWLQAVILFEKSCISSHKNWGIFTIRLLFLVFGVEITSSPSRR